MKQQPSIDPAATPTALVLFDGPCNLCNASVLFIIERDPAGHFGFASLQSDAGQSAMREAGLPPEQPQSVVLIDESGAWTESDAAVRIAERLAGPWSAVSAARVLPRPLRDAVYRLVARNRYRWFGRDECRLPTPELTARLVPEPSSRGAG